jgi:hypothetical protein
MIAFILMGTGALFFSAGLVAYNSASKSDKEKIKSEEMDHAIDLAIADGQLTANERKKLTEMAAVRGLKAEVILSKAEHLMKKKGIQSETQIVDLIKKSGDDFEKFIVQKFNSDFFRVKEWAGDKYVNGIYAETTQQPDLKMEFKLKGKSSLFSVECKWRKEMFNDTVQFARQDQFERYKEFERKEKIPVFIALGIGGTASSPEQLYVLPLKYISENVLKAQDIERYKHNLSKDFYFNEKSKVLH